MNSRPYLSLFTILMSATLLGATGPEPIPEPLVQMASSGAAVSEGIPREIPEMLVQPKDLKSWMDTGEVRLVHVAKSPAGYRKEHIPGAHFLPWKAVAVDKGGENELPSLHRLRAMAHRLGIDPHARVVLYDEEYGVEAARAFFALDAIGLGDRVALLDGQLAGWKAAGLPLTKEETPKLKHHAHEDGVPRRNVVSLKEVKRLVNHKGLPFRLIDARSPEEFLGTKPGEGIKRSGHMPCAVNVPAYDLVESKEMPRWKSPEELRTLLGVSEGAENLRWVPYCRTGAKASLTYFALRYLGLQPRLYDGSFFQWSNGPAPVQPLCTTGPVCSLDDHSHPHEKVVKGTP